MNEVRGSERLAGGSPARGSDEIGQDELVGRRNDSRMEPHAGVRNLLDGGGRFDQTQDVEHPILEAPFRGMREDDVRASLLDRTPVQGASHEVHAESESDGSGLLVERGSSEECPERGTVVSQQPELEHLDPRSREIRARKDGELARDLRELGQSRTPEGGIEKPVAEAFLRRQHGAVKPRFPRERTSAGKKDAG